MDKEKTMQKLVKQLNRAAKAYYQEDKEIMSNYEYDQMYDELAALEKETGIVLEDSPTKRVGYVVISKLQKDKHEEPALSLDKTKDRNFIHNWLDGHVGIMSWKMDGLTIVATYDNGKLTKAVTRGNGEIGEIVTHNAKYFHGLPQSIPCMDHVVVRGEAYIPYSTFEEINAKIPETENKYKNPRNLASGTVRQLDSKIAADRNVHFKAFELVSYKKETLIMNGFHPNLFVNHFCWLKKMGFDVVDHVLVDGSNEKHVIDDFESRIKSNDFPSDGLVMMYNDTDYGKSLGTTGKFPRYGIAFKWKDEMAETTIRKIEWNTSRTGLINPVAVFDTVELEGTEVSRATAHNVSILKKLKLSTGSVIKVYKANMIIPTIHENVKPNGDVEIPDICPVCGEETHIHISDDGIETLYCENQDCPAKHIKSFVHFAKRDSMNIEGLNESTFQKLIDAGLIHKFVDIYHLKEKENEIAELDGMGKRSAALLIENIEKSRNTTLERFLSGLGIPLIGRSASKEISKTFHGDLDEFVVAYLTDYDFSTIPDFGEKMCESLIKYMDEHIVDIKPLEGQLHFQKETTSSTLNGKTFVITGSVTHFKNRDELKETIEKLGGKVSGSVSSKTSYLINNEVTSDSGKNKKAKQLGIPIISEDEFLKLIE